MSYYTLPKKQTMEAIHPRLSSEKVRPMISLSLCHYLSQSRDSVCQANRNEDNKWLCKITHPYDFIHSKVPGSAFSVSKINLLSSSLV